MKKYSLSKTIMSSYLQQEGLLKGHGGMLFKGFEAEPLSCGQLEESLDGPIAESFFQKLSELLTRLPNLFEGHIVLFRKRTPAPSNSLKTKLLFFERVQKESAYSHLNALLTELNLHPTAISEHTWQQYLETVLGKQPAPYTLPDITWERDSLRTGDRVVRVLSLTELPQVTWKGCLQSIFESACEFTLSLRVQMPDRKKIKRQLETKRRVSHALSVTNSLEVKNIESNSVLHSSEETLERILINKETLFEISMGITIIGDDSSTLDLAHNLERIVSGVGNAGLFLEGLGTLPVFKSHIPGEKILGIRKLPILSENLAHILPILHDYSRTNDPSSLELQSRSGELSHLNLFSRENLNFNSFICGASGSGKSFLMNAILSSTLRDDPRTRLCIFDVGGSYRKIVEANGGQSVLLTALEAKSLISTFLAITPVGSSGFFHTFVETLCGSGAHITHSHRVAIDDLLKHLEGRPLQIASVIDLASKKPERFYQDIAHWLKPHAELDGLDKRDDLNEVIRSQATAFDFKELDSDPVLQRTTILLLSELLWRDLVNGTYSRTLIVFDEVWRFFAQSKSFLEEMYRTLRKYRAGIVSITQNLADYGDEAFAKMIFTNSFTKIFLQNGAAAEYLRDTFDLPQSDIDRALSVASKKPIYSEFFVLTPTMSQVFRLHPTAEFYALANTENISQKAKEV